jgi:hypothetical protein
MKLSRKDTHHIFDIEGNHSSGVSSRINGTLLKRIIPPFILLISSIKRRLFIGIDSTGFKMTHASQCYTD